MPKTLSKAGFTLVELMVLCAILGILMAGFMQTMNHQMRLSKGADSDRQVIEIRNQIHTWLYDLNYCTQTFANQRSGENIPGIKNSPLANDYLSKVGDRFPGTDWTIQRMQILSKSDAMISMTSSGSAGSYYGGTFQDLNPSGHATAVLRVTLNRMGYNQNGQNVALSSGQDSGAYGTNQKTFDIPFTAIFGATLDTIGDFTVGDLFANSKLQGGDQSFDHYAATVYCNNCNRTDGKTQAQALTDYSGVTDTSLTYYESAASGIQGESGWGTPSPTCPTGTYAATYGATVLPLSAQVYCVPLEYTNGAGAAPYWVNGYVYNYELPILSCVTVDGKTNL
jgi:type II secretory pathway pseudopilin PulG